MRLARRYAPSMAKQAVELHVVSDSTGETATRLVHALEAQGKPDPALFELSVEAAGVVPGASVMVGDRLDYDMRPAARAGMHTIWMLRGEAPDEPTPEQLAETDAAIRSLAELPTELERLSSP